MKSDGFRGLHDGGFATDRNPGVGCKPHGKSRLSDPYSFRIKTAGDRVARFVEAQAIPHENHRNTGWKKYSQMEINNK
jgi:hypothetical protein